MPMAATSLLMGKLLLLRAQRCRDVRIDREATAHGSLRANKH